MLQEKDLIDWIQLEIGEVFIYETMNEQCVMAKYGKNRAILLDCNSPYYLDPKLEQGAAETGKIYTIMMGRIGVKFGYPNFFFSRRKSGRVITPLIFLAHGGRIIKMDKKMQQNWNPMVY